jgi:hypothetical protein
MNRAYKVYLTPSKYNAKAYHYKFSRIFIGHRDLQNNSRGKFRIKRKKIGRNINLLFNDKILPIHKSILTKFM